MVEHKRWGGVRWNRGAAYFAPLAFVAFFSVFFFPFFSSFFFPIFSSFSLSSFVVRFSSLSLTFRAFFCLGLLSSDDRARLRALGGDWGCFLDLVLGGISWGRWLVDGRRWVGVLVVAMVSDTVCWQCDSVTVSVHTVTFFFFRSFVATYKR